MKNTITFLLIAFLSVSIHAQDKTKKTNFQYSKSNIVHNEIESVADIKDFKEKDFEEDERTITIKPTEKVVVFDLGFVEKTIDITSEEFSLIDKQWELRLGDSNFAFLIIGDNYSIIKLEEDKRNLILINSQFKFK